MAAWRVLLAFPLLAGLALAQEAVERDVRLAGTIQLDGRPWSGGRARLQPLQRDADLPEGPPIDVLADERGEFAVRVPRLACRLHAGPGWPEGAATRVEPERTPARPGEPLVWVTWAHGMHGTIHDEDEPLHIEVFSPVPVAGQVVGEDGRAVQGAQVTVEESAWVGPDREPLPPLAASVDATGWFELRVPVWFVHRTLSIVARAPGRPLGAAGLGLEEQAREPERWVRDVVAPAPVTIRLAERPLLVEGSVVDLDGRGVVRARLRVVSTVVDQRVAVDPGALEELAFDLLADEQGRFRLELPPGSGLFACGPTCATAQLEVTGPGYSERFLQHCAGPASAPLLVTLVRTGLPLSGRIVGPGGPIADATVHAGDARATTGADGRFALAAHELEDLVVRAPGYAVRVVRVRVGVELLIALDRAGSISGRLLDPGGRPSSGVEVVATLAQGAIEEEEPELPRVGELLPLPLGLGLGWGEPLATTRTDADGRFELRDLPPGVDLRIEAGGMRAVARVGEVVELRQSSTAPPLRCTLRGRAVAAEDGAELHAFWWVRPGAGEGRGCEGRLDVLSDHQPQVTVHVSAPGRIPVAVGPFEVTGPVQQLADVQLRRGGQVALDLRWPDVPVGRLEAEWSDPDGTSRFAETRPPRSAGAAWTIDGLAPGEVVLRCSAYPPRGGEPLGVREVRVVVRAGDEARAALDLSDLR